MFGVWQKDLVGKSHSMEKKNYENRQNRKKNGKENENERKKNTHTHRMPNNLYYSVY